MAQLTERFCLDLPDPLTGHVKLFAHLLQRVVGIHINTKAHAQYLGLAGGQTAEYLAGRLGQPLFGGGLYR